MKFEINYIVTFVVYFIIVLTIGGIASRYTHDTEDFVLGGRSLGSWIVALGAGASDMSGWLMLGLPGGIYLFGLDQIWMPIGLTLGALINWAYVAKRLRVYTEEAKNSLTIPAFFENRYHDVHGLLRLVTSIAVITFFTLYVSAGFVSAAVLFQSTFNLSYETALLTGAAIIMTYTCIGGFLAVNWIDLFQGTLMWFALIIVPAMTFWALWHGHGTTTTQPIDAQFHAALAFPHLNILGILSLAAWGLGYFGQPHILVRFMAAKDPKQIPQSAWICMSWMIMSLIGAMLTGLFGRWYFEGQPLSNPESVFLELAKILFNPIFASILLAAVLSAVMSTIAAQLLAACSSLAEDIYFRFITKETSDSQGLFFNRIAVLIIASIALYLAKDPNSRVLTLVGYAWAGLGASFGPLILCSLFWSRTTRNGAIMGIIVGAVTVIVWKNLTFLGGIFTVYELLPAFFMGLGTIIVVSLLDKRPDPTIIEEFQRVKLLTNNKGN